MWLRKKQRRSGWAVNTDERLGADMHKPLRERGEKKHHPQIRANSVFQQTVIVYSVSKWHANKSSKGCKYCGTIKHLCLTSILWRQKSFWPFFFLTYVSHYVVSLSRPYTCICRPQAFDNYFPTWETSSVVGRSSSYYNVFQEAWIWSPAPTNPPSLHAKYDV